MNQEGGNSLASPEVLLNMTGLEPSTMIHRSAPEARHCTPTPSDRSPFSRRFLNATAFCEKWHGAGFVGSERDDASGFPPSPVALLEVGETEIRKIFKGKKQPIFVVLFHEKGLRKETAGREGEGKDRK